MMTIALIGGGPAALFMFKRLVESGLKDIEITIFEQHEKLGAGMPYSSYGSAEEHITNVSENEIPEIKTGIEEWLSIAPPERLQGFTIAEEDFNEYKVLPRLLFGEYLSAQFEMLLKEARRNKVPTQVYLQTKVADVVDLREREQVKIITSSNETYYFDKAVICTGHSWPCDKEKEIENWFDSPYPPQKLSKLVNYPVAIKGASLTAVDAIRSLAHANGYFTKNADSTFNYVLNEASKGFKIVLHSIGGMLPALRFHLEDSHLEPEHLLAEEEIVLLKEEHNGFVPLDVVYDLNFKNVLKTKNADLYEEVKDMSIEAFIAYMMEKRNSMDAFDLLKAEYKEAEASIDQEKSIIWKESLAALSYAMNYPAKHFSAEDMLRLTTIMMPLISVVIAFLPQSSAREIMALHEKGLITIKDVDASSKVLPGEKEGCIYRYSQTEQAQFKMFIDAVGQRPFFYNQVPFEGLKNKETLSAAYLRFACADEAKREMEAGNKSVMSGESGDYILQLPGININDYFQPLDIYGVANPRLHIMAVPFIAGLNPDYSGLDFCETSSEVIMKKIKEREN